ncbi:Ribosomal protein L11 methyltransferase [Botrimarina colliarenosi]|uniref:Ribosomal protein L11 methyltransferase n=1 Tax=Botrimarina colliarenosi TaxID=2528001 RepID=A0A5C6ALE6_9BACT|nr:hypothetical protein [Botrimarina colliarenosi]TWT99851.1 Ribosomal protein L11 methyltransferase [Botrimarina colliarenosi]
MARLLEIELVVPPLMLPQRMRDLLDDADDRIERFHHRRRDNPAPAFVPSDFVESYRALSQVTALSLAPGSRFVEWGSGVGVVTCQASLLGFDAIGIEIESELVDEARALAEDHNIETEFIHGSFVPDGGDEVLEANAYNLARTVTWLSNDAPSAYDELGLDPDDFDLVFAYPWPGEEETVFELFAEFAAVGALLLTHHGEEGMRLQRKRR